MKNHKPSTYPISVLLSSLNENGEKYSYSQTTGELTATLKDLISNDPYAVTVEIRPLGNAFEISGLVDTQLRLNCSHCGRDTTYKVNNEFRELILVEDERPRGGHTGHSGGDLVNDGPYCNYVNSYNFNIADFIHEQIASQEPYIVECGLNDCETVMKAAQLSASAAENADFSPFSVLKNLKG